jgi:hypothetical protein
MTAQFQPAAAYSRALALNGQAFAAGHYEIAYHFLMAAVHCAQDLSDTRRLKDLSALAREQCNALDQRAPIHRLASKTGHGGRSIFAMVAGMADAVAQRIENEDKMAADRRVIELAEPNLAELDGKPA